jgi:HEAT repeat protein
MESTKEIDRVLDLLDKVQRLSPGEGIPDEVNQELLVLARQAGAGGCGQRSAEYERMRHAVETSAPKRQRLLDSLSADTPHARSWAGSFIEQLFPQDEAISRLTTALEAETDPEAASWLSMSLARSLRGAPDQKACAAIRRAYDRATTSPEARLQTARAWGYAGCSEALPSLASHLLTGGFDQKTVALDGMGALGSVDHPKAVEALWTTFGTAPWLDLISKCARLLVSASGTHRLEAIQRMLKVLSDSSTSRVQREAAAKAISTTKLPSEISEKCFLTIVQALVLNDGSIAADVLGTLKRSYSDWASRLAKQAVASPDERLSAGLVRALASDDKARASAVRILQRYTSDEDPVVRDRATRALKDIGGEEAFQTLQELLKSRYIQPSDELQEVSYKVFKDTVERMKGNYETSLTMNQVVFWLGFGVIIIGVVSVFIHPSENKFFGTAGIVAGLGTLVSLFFFGPLTRVQQALTELVQIEIAFMAFMHRLLQARSIFEKLYLAESIDLDSLTRFDELLQKGMSGTVELLEENITKTRSNRATSKSDAPNQGMHPTAQKPGGG